MGNWVARARYADGTEFEKSFPYLEDGNFYREEERKYELECFLIEGRESEPIWFSVNYEEDWEDEDCLDEPVSEDELEI